MSEEPPPPKLSSAQLETIRLHINQKWKHVQCRRCDVTDWSAEGPLYLPFDQPQVVGGKLKVLPAVVLVCKNCGSFEVLSSVIVGVHPKVEQ